MSQSPVDVLIIGAGPTGLTMACELRRLGITCRILDKTEAPATTSRAIGLQARSLEVFATMGIVEPALAQGVSGISVNAYSGACSLFTLDFRFLADERFPYPYGVLLPQNQTEQILLDLLHKLGGQVERSREMLDFRCEHEPPLITVRSGAIETATKSSPTSAAPAPVLATK
jgi:2-polyprenyl-6-methoxyphenol hydroxylase-like FAD-dependent oxidoreductase